MSVTRHETGPRMSQIVIHGNTVYLAGQVGAPSGNVASQTRDILAAIDELLAKAGRLDAILEKAAFGIAGGTSLFRLARHPDALQRHTALARRHIWCRSFDWADDLLRFGLPPDDAGLDRLAAALRD